MRECGGDDAKGMVNYNEGVRSLGGREMCEGVERVVVCVVGRVVRLVLWCVNGKGYFLRFF